MENVYIKKQDITGSFTRQRAADSRSAGISITLTTWISPKGSCIMSTATVSCPAAWYPSSRADSAVWDGKVWKTENMELVNLSTAGIQLEKSTTTLPLNRGPADLVMAQPAARGSHAERADRVPFVSQGRRYPIRKPGYQFPQQDKFCHLAVHHDPARPALRHEVSPGGRDCPGDIRRASFSGLHTGRCTRP